MINLLSASLRDITVNQFVQHMRTIKSANDTLSIPAFVGNGVRIVWELDGSTIGLAKARNIPCKFYGGPPHGRDTYEGTLLVMLIDRILDISFEDPDILEYFLEDPEEYFPAPT